MTEQKWSDSPLIVGLLIVFIIWVIMSFIRLWKTIAG